MKKVVAGETGNRVIIKQSEAAKKQGDWIIPDTAAVKPVEGTVVAVSEKWIAPDGREVSPVVSKGDLVLYDKFGGHEILPDGNQYLVMLESKIIVII